VLFEKPSTTCRQTVERFLAKCDVDTNDVLALLMMMGVERPRWVLPVLAVADDELALAAGRWATMGVDGF